MIELITPEFYNREFMGKMPPYRIIGRPKMKGERHYATIFQREPGENEDPKRIWFDPKVYFFPGVTTINRDTTSIAPNLLEWYAKHGMEKAERLRDSAAARGTIMHSLFVAVARGELRGFETKGFNDEIEMRIRLQGYEPKEFPDWKEFFIKAIMSFIQWVNDYDVVFHALEIGLVSGELGFAGQIDVVCEMNDKEYTEKTPKEKRTRCIGIVDFKSGEHFYDEHVTQLGLYKPLLYANFPHLKKMPIQLYNWKPSDFRDKPTYTLKNQTKGVERRQDECAAMLNLFQVRRVNTVHGTMTRYKGIPKLGIDPSTLSESVTFEEHWAGLVADLLSPGPAKRKRGRPKKNPGLADITPKEQFQQLELQFS